MNKRIKNILRCYAAGIGIKETAFTFHISRNTVRKYVRLFLSSGKSIEQLLSLPNGQLDEQFGCTDTRHREPSSKRIELEALLPGYVSRLSRKGMSVRKLFKEYHTEYPDGYQLSSFKRIVSEYRFHIKVVGHVEHYAAEQMYIDFAGDRLEVVDEMTGETKKAEVFVAILPFRLPGYVSRLSRKGMSVRKLFKEYHTEYPDGYQLSSFKRIVSEYRFHIKVVGHVEHYAAEQMYIDFAGDRLEVVDEMTGETKKAEVFVAILPFSHYTYCEAVWSQRKEDLIKACENAIQYFEGVPAAIVPDNLKAAVTRSDRNEPVINDDFAAFAEYYGCVVYPARVRHPKDKALVENAVKLLYRSIYLDIEGMTFSSLEELNTAIHISLLDFNEKVMAGREMSRKEIFLHGEKDYLRPLPVKRYVMKERKLMTVGKNSYVSLFKHHYSVPKEYVGRRMTILYDADTVEIYCGMNLVATHDRCDIPYTYSWKKEHNLPGHYGPYDKDLEELFQRASEIDNIVLNYLREVERVMQYPNDIFQFGGTQYRHPYFLA
jgi:transposase